ncbi:MAG: carbohydrate-binding domain-containing protein [Bacteroidales bacterium]|nr:carbohydrate-binding domain-containing protein [Bacteroidales bacterium]
MKKILILSILLVAVLVPSFAQEVLNIHHNGQVTYEAPVSDIDSITFSQGSALFATDNGSQTFSFADIDSVTFVYNEDTSLSGGDIYITYNGTSVTVINPLESSGVAVTTDNANVTVQAAAGIMDINYHVSGSSTSGYLYITSDRRYNLCLEGVSITNPAGPAIYSVVDQKVHVYLSGTNTLTDNASSTYKAAFQSKGQLIFGGTGYLTVNGLAKNGIHSDDHIKINEGNITVASAVNDGLHCDYFVMEGGSLTISASGDGIDGDEGFVLVEGGTIQVMAAVADTKGIKCDSTLTINGGNVTIVCSGNQTKGLKSAQSVVISGGTLNITASGSTVLESTTEGNDPAYCSAIVADQDIIITGGDITLTLPSSNHGGKGISSDGNVNISGGTLQITTAGAGAAYTVSGSTMDSYSSSCIKSDGTTTITGGNITCSSTGSGGKGIRSEGDIIIGSLNEADSNLILNVSTSGERFTVSSGGGGGWPGGGGSSDYCNPKGVRSDAAVTINSGIITVTCTQNNEGGECIESKTIMTINGGNLTITSAYDDALNAANRLNINGGTIYAASSHNDAIDSNGPMYITGGLIIASATSSPEEAFDCDNNTFSITGGTIIGTAPSGMYSNPTTSACSQHSMKYTHAGNNAVQIIRNSDNTVLLTFHVPSISGGGSSPWGGGSSSVIMTFSSPEFTSGSYTLKYGGTISGGTNFHNYYTGATYSGGSSKTFTVGSSYAITSVN